MRLLWFHYIFSLLYILTLISSLVVSLEAITIKDGLPSSSSSSSTDLIDLFYSDSNDRNTRHLLNNQPGSNNNQQVIYINHGNGAISSIRRSSNSKLPFSPHVLSYPNSPFDNNQPSNERDFKLEPIPLIENYPVEVNKESSPLLNSNRISEGEIDHHRTAYPPQPALVARRPSRRSATPIDTNKPSRLIYDSPPPPPSNPSPSLQPPIPSPPVSSLKPLPSPINRSPPSQRPRVQPTDPFLPFNFDTFFTRDPSFDIERNVIGNNSPSPPPTLPRTRPSSLTDSSLTRFPDANPPPPPPPSSSSIIVDNDIDRKPEDERTTIEPRVRKQVPNTGSPPSAYSGRSTNPPITTPAPLRNQFQGPTFGPSLGGADENGFLPAYGPAGFGLPGGQDIFPFFDTPFLPLNPTNDGFQRRRLANNNAYHNNNNLGAYGNPHHSSSPPPPPPPPPPPSSNSINDNSIGNGAGYPSYSIYKGADDDDAGVKWPKIFKFTDGRVNLSEFERNKKSGKIKFNNKEDAYLDDIRRDSFLILHGGTYN